MKKTIVVKNVPMRLPVVGTAFYSFLMYYFGIGGVWLGVYICVMVLYWIIAILAVWNQEQVHTDDLIKKELKK